MRRQTRGSTGRRLLARTVFTAVLAGSVLGVAGPALADASAAVPVSCDRPNTGITPGLFADLNTEIPDPLQLDSSMQVADAADPVVAGGPTSFTLDLPFPDLSGGFPPNDLGVTYGTFYIKSVDITVPIPAGLDATTVSPVEAPDRNYVTASRSGANLLVHVQSPVAGSRIRINTEVASPVAEVETSAGVWTPVVMPGILVNPTVTGAPGSTITWTAPTLTNLVVKWNRDFGFLVGRIDWNDLPVPCIPQTPGQVVATTTVGRPALSVSTRADETAVVAGSVVHLHVTATNTGDVPLTGVVVTDTGAPGCAGSPGTLAVGARVTLDCTVTTSNADIPTFSNTAGADSNETTPVTSNTVGVTVASADSTGVSGQVVDSVSGGAVPAAWVALLRTADFSLAGGAVADGSGNFASPLPVGDYFAYGLDPSGRHAAGFFGSPTRLTVGAGAMTAANPALVPNRGAVGGTVTEQGTGTVLGGAWALALSGRTGAPETLAITDGAGRFTVADLPSGNHLMLYLDRTGAHAPEFFGDAPNAGGAVPVAVTGGTTTTANGTPPAQGVAGAGSTLSGNVTESGTNLPLAGVSVIAMRAADYQFVVATETDASGNYSLSLPAGAYKVVFLDGSGRHHQEWYDNQPYTGIGSAHSVSAPGSANASLDRNSGTMAGTVTDDPSGTPLVGAWVVAIGANGVAGGAITAGDGSYAISGLPAGTYRATFLDPGGGRPQEYWNNASSFGGAAPLTIAGGETTTINAGLHLP